MNKKQQSLLDFLIDYVNKEDTSRSPSLVNASVAHKLFQIWQDPKNKVEANIYKKPQTISSDDVSSLQKEGLVKAEGNMLHITQKGSEVIKILVLGDDRSSFEEDGSNLNYHTACQNVKGKKKKGSKVQDSWWERFV